jgi:hypothetical protein
MALRTNPADRSPEDGIVPMLEAVPRGVVMYASRLAPAWPEATVLHSDGRWRPATPLAWCRYQAGWAALIRWPDGREEWRRHDPDCLRRSVEHLGGWGDARRPLARWAAAEVSGSWAGVAGRRG